MHHHLVGHIAIKDRAQERAGVAGGEVTNDGNLFHLVMLEVDRAHEPLIRGGGVFELARRGAEDRLRFFAQVLTIEQNCEAQQIHGMDRIAGGNGIVLRLFAAGHQLLRIVGGKKE